MLKVIEPSEKRIIRFAIGSEDKPTSFIWRLWTTRNDAYLIFAPHHEPKFSMHRHVWKIDLKNNRHSFRPMTCAQAPGWIQGPAVMFCHVPYDALPPPMEIFEQTKSKNIRWFPTPPDWYLSEFIVFFRDENLAKDQLPPRDITVSSEQFAIGPLPLAGGRCVWLRHLTKTIPENRKEYLLKLRSSVKGFKVDTAAKDLRSLCVLLHLHKSTIVAVPFGLESLQTK